MKKAALHNLGCKVNSYETEAMKQQLNDAGYEIVPFSEVADVYIVNTCTVTNIADRKSRQMLHKAKKMNPEGIVVAVGCYVQAAGEELEKDLSVDIIIGNNKKNDLIDILEGKQSKKDIIDIGTTPVFEEMKLEKITQLTRSNIKIQDGCNQFCSYCIIPYTRGRVRSRKILDVITEIKNLANSGCKEVVLTGIHTASYGVDFMDGTTLITLIKDIHEIKGIERIRLSSLEQGIISEEFISELCKLKKVCPHFHLSLQSGSKTVLTRMNRKYSPDDFLEKCMIIRKYYKNPGITTDIIVGFPGETDEEFNETKEFVKKVEFSSVHVFKYSKRKGTKAAVMPNQVPDRIKSDRSDELIRLAEEMKNRFKDRLVGEKVFVLFEEQELINGKFFQIGYTMEYIKIAVISDENLTNQIKEVKVTNNFDKEILLAEI